MNWKRISSRTALGLLLTAGPALAQPVPGVLPMNITEDSPAKVSRPPVAQPVPGVLPTNVGPARVICPACVAPAPTCSPTWWAQHKARAQARFWGYPEEFDAPPLGAMVYAHNSIMIANGEATRQVLFHYDFLAGRAGLNTHGIDRLERMVARMAETGDPIIIERTPDTPGLADARRAAVLTLLASEGLGVSPDRVLVGTSLSVGMPGVDAVRIDGYQVTNMGVQSQPIPVPNSNAINGGGTSVGSSGGSGTSGGQGTGTGH